MLWKTYCTLPPFILWAFPWETSGGRQCHSQIRIFYWSSLLEKERESSENSQRIEEKGKKAIIYKLYVIRVWGLFFLKNISTFSNRLESIYCLTRSSPSPEIAHLCVWPTRAEQSSWTGHACCSHPKGRVSRPKTRRLLLVCFPQKTQNKIKEKQLEC